jgi:hypothetical protein
MVINLINNVSHNWKSCTQCFITNSLECLAHSFYRLTVMLILVCHRHDGEELNCIETIAELITKQ